jgi:hypothetical protein
MACSDTCRAWDVRFVGRLIHLRLTAADGEMRVPRRLVGSFVTGALCVVAPVVWWRNQLAASKAGPAINFFNYDEYQYTVPALRYAAERLRQGRLPLWAPEQLCGGPFLATQLHGILYPLHWLIVPLPLDVVWKILLVAHGIVAMAGTVLCARVFGVRRSAALLAGVTYAFSGMMTGAATFSMEPAVVSIAWLPWQLAFTRAALRAEYQWAPPAIGLGLVSALCVVGGHLPYLQVAIVVCTLYAVMHLGWITWREGLWFAIARGARLLLGPAVAAGLAAVQLLPTLELAVRSARAGAFQSAQAADPFPIAPDNLLVGLVNSLPMYCGSASVFFVGVAALGLALVPFIDGRHRRAALALWGMGSLVTLLALGTSTPVFGWYFHLQGSYSGLPQRFTAGTALSLALLSALGVDVLCRTRRTVVALLGVAVTSAVPLILVAAVAAGLSASNPRLSAALALTRNHTLWLAGISSVFLLPLGWSSRRVRSAVILAGAGLLAYELYGSMKLRAAIPATRPDAVRIAVEAAAFVRRQGGLVRVVTPISRQRKHIPVRVGMLENLQTVSDYEPLVDRRFTTLMWTLSSFGVGPGNAHLGPYMDEVTQSALPLLRFLGVGFVMVPRNGGVPVRLAGPIYSDAEAEVYPVPDPLPRAYVAKDVRVVSTPEQAQAVVLGSTSWVLQGGAVVEDGRFAAQGSDGSVVVRRYDAEEVELEANLSRPGLVVLQDRYDPYWRASVDGVEVPIMLANYVFRGVGAGAGLHTIHFWYHPSLIYVGAGISLLTFFALLAATILWLHRGLTREPQRDATPAACGLGARPMPRQPLP